MFEFSWTTLWVISIAAFGTAYIAGHAKISLFIRQWLFDTKFKPFRYLVELIECPACLGFWLGVIGWLVRPNPTVSDALIAGCFVSGSNALLGFWSGLMQRHGRV